MAITVSIIGAGRIGRQVIEHVNHAPRLRLGSVLTRSADPAAFFARPADLVVDCAGPEALRRYGVDCLRRADLWTVSAAALIEDALRVGLETVAGDAGTRLCLFAPWIAGIGQGQAISLELHVSRPGSGASFSGSLREAAALFPDELNFATAAALCGPGIEATRITMEDAAPHRLEARLTGRTGRFTTSVTFTGQGPHPTAQSIIAGLDRLHSPIGYGGTA